MTRRKQNTKKRLSAATAKTDESVRVPFQYEEGSSPFFVDGPASAGEFLNEWEEAVLLQRLFKKRGKGRPTLMKTDKIIAELDEESEKPDPKYATVDRARRHGISLVNLKRILRKWKGKKLQEKH